MNEEYCQCIGKPLKGQEKEKLIDFLKKQELEYDEGIEYSIVLEDDKEVIATGSFHGNVIKCVAVDQAYQGQNLLSVIMTHLVGQLFERKIYHYFGFTKPKNKKLFGSMGLYPVAETEHILLMESKKNGLQSYIKQLIEETKNVQNEKQENKDGTGIGAIVANCNPYTYGHEYLIKEAAKQCKWLHIFVLSSKQEFATAKERYHMVSEGTKNITNVILHHSSDYLISPAVFPTYFIKDKVHAFSLNCMLDIKIFCEEIACNLDITKRFVGTEPNCLVTNEYNQCLNDVLPQYGIDVIEVNRLEKEGMVISASSVRRAVENGETKKVLYMVPDVTKEYLNQRKGMV